MGNKITDTGLI